MEKLVFFRVDANEQIATGHMMRCKTIAYELIQLGKQVTFLVSDHDSMKLLEDDAFSYSVLNTKWDNLNTETELNVVRRILTKSCKEDKEIPILFVDSYFVKNDYFRVLKKYAKIVFLDDLAKEIYDVDVVINYNITYAQYDYSNRYKDKNIKLILGTNFIPLRRQFGEDSVVKKDYNISGRPHILIMCGGSDSKNVLYMILCFLSQQENFERYYYNVVVGLYHPNIKAIRELSNKHNNINLLYNVNNIAEVMKKSDMAITTASTVLYECCAVGLPAAFFIVADNQEPDVKVFCEKYNLIYLGDFREKKKEVLENIYVIIERFVSDLETRKNTAKKMRKIVDGKGAQRIANLMVRMNEVGSFFEEELVINKKKKALDEDKLGRIRLWNDGRTAIADVLDDLESSTGNRKVCFLPEYTCDTVILPFERHNYRIYFYKVQKNLSVDSKCFTEGMYHYRPNVVLLHPYYGCNCLDNVYEIINKYRKSDQVVIIEDLTQSLFLYDMAVARADYVVCSLRKWFAIPDGGFSLRVDKSSFKTEEENRNKVYGNNEHYIKTKQLAQRFKYLYLQGEDIRKQKFLDLNRNAEQILYNLDELYGMSEYAKKYLQNTDINKKKEQRRKNVKFLWEKLKKMNVKMAINWCDSFVPLYMPIYVEDRENVQRKLRENNIYAPVLWPIPKQLVGSVSKDADYIYKHLLALPCDHRYDELDMLHIIKVLKDL